MFQILLIFCSNLGIFSTLFPLPLALLSSGTAISTIMHFLSPLFTTTMSYLLALITLSQWIFTSRSSFTSFFTGSSGEGSCHFSCLSNLYFLHNSKAPYHWRFYSLFPFLSLSNNKMYNFILLFKHLRFVRRACSCAAQNRDCLYFRSAFLNHFHVCLASVDSGISVVN